MNIYTHLVISATSQPILSNWGEHVFFAIHGMVLILVQSFVHWRSGFEMGCQTSKHAVEFPAFAI